MFEKIERSRKPEKEKEKERHSISWEKEKEHEYENEKDQDLRIKKYEICKIHNLPKQFACVSQDCGSKFFIECQSCCFDSDKHSKHNIDTLQQVYNVMMGKLSLLSRDKTDVFYKCLSALKTEFQRSEKLIIETLKQTYYGILQELSGIVFGNSEMGLLLQYQQNILNGDFKHFSEKHIDSMQQMYEKKYSYTDVKFDIDDLRQNIEITTKRLNVRTAEVCEVSLQKDLEIFSNLKGIFQDFPSESDSILSIAMVNANYFITAGKSNNIYVRNRLSGQIVNTLKGHDKQVNYLLNLDDQHIASCSNDFNVKIWNIQSEVEIHSFEYHTDCVNRMALVDENIIVSCSWDETIQFFDWRNLLFIESISMVPYQGCEWVTTLRPGLFATANCDCFVRIFDLNVKNPDKRIVQVLQGSLRPIFVMSLINDHQLAGAGGTEDDTSIYIWLWTTGNLVKKVSGHTNWVTAICQIFTSIIVSSSNDQSLRIWRYRQGQQIKQFEFSTKILSMAVNGNKIILGMQNGTLVQIQ